MKSVTMSDAVRDKQSPETLAALGMVRMGFTPVKPPVKAKNKMTKTETKFLNEILRPREQDGEINNILFHPCNLYMQNGHRYTPDFRYDIDGDIFIVEVKGSYRLPSYRSARLACDQARIEWPCFVWEWAELQEDGTWKTSLLS